MERINREEHAKDDKENKVKFFKYQGDMEKGKTQIKTLQEEKVILSGKLQKSDSNSQEFATTKWELWESMKKALDTHGRLKDEVTFLKEDLEETSNI